MNGIRVSSGIGNCSGIVNHRADRGTLLFPPSSFIDCIPPLMRSRPFPSVLVVNGLDLVFSNMFVYLFLKGKIICLIGVTHVFIPDKCLTNGNM